MENRFTFTTNIKDYSGGSFIGVLDWMLEPRGGSKVGKKHRAEEHLIRFGHLETSIPKRIVEDADTWDEGYDMLMNQYYSRINTKVSNNHLSNAIWLHYEHYMDGGLFNVNIHLINGIENVSYYFTFDEHEMYHKVTPNMFNSELFDNSVLSFMHDNDILVEWFFKYLGQGFEELSDYIHLEKSSYSYSHITMFGNVLWSEEDDGVLSDDVVDISYTNLIDDCLKELDKHRKLVGEEFQDSRSTAEELARDVIDTKKYAHTRIDVDICADTDSLINDLKKLGFKSFDKVYHDKDKKYVSYIYCYKLLEHKS